MKKCIFCKIVQGKLPCHKIYEDKEHLAFLDIQPNTAGMALVIPKKHYASYTLDMPEKKYAELMKATRKVAKQIDKNLGVKRTAMVMEGLGIDHAHIKLYPLHGLKRKYMDIFAKERVFFKKYKGYVTSLLGPRADDKELAKIAEKIHR